MVYSPEIILEQILEPSKAIHPDYLTHVIKTKDGTIVSGLMMKRSSKEWVVKESPEKTIRIPAADVEATKPGRLSAMPEQLLQSLTPQEAADLISYLSSLR